MGIQEINLFVFKWALKAFGMLILMGVDVNQICGLK